MVRTCSALLQLAAAPAEEGRDLARVESLTKEPPIQLAKGLAIGGQGLSAQPAVQGVGEESVFIDVGEDRGNGRVGGLAIDAERLHLAQDPTRSVSLDGHVVPGPRAGGALVVEESVRDEPCQDRGDDVVGVMATPEPDSSL